MTKRFFSRKPTAVFLALVFLNSIVPYNLLYANNGPKAPEAAGFEPIDATDMVSLLTGDFSYVLPLMTIPGPEGGYPISLSYHAGIALDQEASWTGLGWNLNPGVINRNVNGLPDDYKNAIATEHFYSSTEEEDIHTFSIGFTSSIGGSVGLNLSWGSNKALGGSVSLGYGIPLGSKGGAGTLGVNVTTGESNSLSVGYSPTTGDNGKGGKAGLTFGVGISEGQGVSASIGHQTSNGEGFSVSASSSGTYGASFSGNNGGKGNSVGLNLTGSKNGVGIFVRSIKSRGKSVVGGGTGININFKQTISSSNYSTRQTGFYVPIFVPTPIGSFSAGYGKQKYEWYLNQVKKTNYYGTLNFDANFSNEFQVVCANGFSEVFYTPEDAQHAIETQEASCAGDDGEACHCSVYSKIESVGDIYEFPLDQIGFNPIDKVNAIFPNHDNYTVDAQGLSGSMSISHFDNGTLFGMNKSTSELSVRYPVRGSNSFLIDPEYAFETDNKYNFYMDNEFSSYLGTEPIALDMNKLSAISILDYNISNDISALNRKKQGTFVDYITSNENVDEFGLGSAQRGFMNPTFAGDLNRVGNDALQGFMVTNSDGMRYHYALPVLNHSIVTRNLGVVKDQDGNPKPETDGYFERIQNQPYATHWLLTAITGPDFIDSNGNFKPDENDKGYWVEFEYGKWSDAYAWKTPYFDEYDYSKDDDDYKSQTKGFKDVWYLDKIRTRTHTAVFVKSKRHDNQSYDWEYYAVAKEEEQVSSDFSRRFNIPQQESLKLDKIILLKNEDAHLIQQDSGNMVANSESTHNIDFEIPDYSGYNYIINRENSVIDTSDLPDGIEDKALKIVKLGYSNPLSSLALGTPNTSSENTGRLTLERVNFQGKGGTEVVPPYNFKYYDGTFDYDNKNEWGYDKDQPWKWSLKEIITPIGSSIEIEYESDDFHKPAIQNGRLFTRGLQFTLLSYPTPGGSNPNTAPTDYIDIKVEVDENDPFGENIILSRYFDISKSFFLDMWYSAITQYPIGAGFDRASLDIKEQQAEILSISPDGKSMDIRVLASSPFFHDDNALELANPFSFLSAGSPGSSTLNYRRNLNHGRYELAWVDEWRSSDRHRYSLQFKMIANKDLQDLSDGDLRVKNIKTSISNKSATTNYTYNDLEFNKDPKHNNYRSSGAVSYVPNVDNNPIPYSSELPAPKVMYETVAVNNLDENDELQSKTVYSFNVLKEKSESSLTFGEFLRFDTQRNSFYNQEKDADVEIASITVHDNLSSIGQLKKIESYNKYDQLVSKSENEYFKNDDRIDNQGVNQQSYQSYKVVEYDESLDKNDKWIVSSSTRRTYAQALKSSTTTARGNMGKVDYVTYDPVTGNSLESITTTSN